MRPGHGYGSVFLVGPMGSGKTAVGRQVARLLSKPFLDSDHEIELRTGADIALIFEREGEAGFRRRERAAIEELTARAGIVLATGGGAVLSEENRAHLKNRGWVVYLETSVGQQAERAGRTSHRPLLAGTDARSRLEELATIREPLYRQIADFTISTTRRKVGQVAAHIATAYRDGLLPESAANVECTGPESG